MSSAIRVAALVVALGGCVHGHCVASTAGVHGSVTTCCSAEPRYQWNGTRCEQDTACECDAQPASPTWSSLSQCEDVHHKCGSFDQN